MHTGASFIRTEIETIAFVSQNTSLRTVSNCSTYDRDEMLVTKEQHTAVVTRYGSITLVSYAPTTATRPPPFVTRCHPAHLVQQPIDWHPP